MARDTLTIDVQWREVVRWRKRGTVPRSDYEEDPEQAIVEAICAATDWGLLGVEERDIEKAEIVEE